VTAARSIWRAARILRSLTTKFKAGDLYGIRKEHYSAMMVAIARYAPYVDMSKVDGGMEYAQKKHADQKRKDGSPYIIHPLAVAEIVAEIGLDTDAIIGALLHDCIEDTDASYEEIEKLFGQTVAELVEGVTKLTRVQYSTTGRAADGESAQDVHGHVQGHPRHPHQDRRPPAQHAHAGVPVAGEADQQVDGDDGDLRASGAPARHAEDQMGARGRLAEVSRAEGVQRDHGLPATRIRSRLTSSCARSRAKITTRLSGVGIHGNIYGRVKHVYSIYRKMKAQNKTLDELYDLYAFRVIVDSIPDCYNVLGTYHDLFNIVPGRFKDYISTPKPNMYQSLHTTVIGTSGHPVRGADPHVGDARDSRVRRRGALEIQAGRQQDGDEKDFEWIRRLLESQQDTDAEEYVHSLKVDMFNDEVFVFTPKGKVISLPSGSTPIDFAYAIHSGVGNAMVGAKINNRIANYRSSV
jgi:GTP pyrophosphokinase